MTNNLIESCVGRSCVVISMQNDTLFKGVITEYLDDNTTIKSDIFTKELVLGNAIKVFSVNREGKDIIFKGYTVFSNNNGIKLQKTTIINGDENRKFYRVNINLQSEIILDISDDVVETTNIEDYIFNVSLEDISVGGCSFSTNKELQEGLSCTIKIVLDDRCLMLMSVIRRKIKDKGEYKIYGAEFLLLTDAEVTTIEAFVAKKNRNDIITFRNMLKNR